MYRISLSNAAFEGDNDVYLFDEGETTTLVDTGDWHPATRTQLTDALERRGLAFADVDRILLSHWHMDHTGLAGAIQAESGAEVLVHEADAPLVAGDDAAWTAMRERQDRLFEQWGMPEGKQQSLRERMADHGETGRAPDVTSFADGDTFAVGDGELTVRHASGHAAGACWFELDGGVVDRDAVDGEAADGNGADTDASGVAAATEILSGDVLLPEYTPNVGGADVRVDAPLAKYLQALSTIADADYARAWPGHRDPIADPTARAEEIIDHHEERAYRVLAALEELGPSDAWAVSAALFGDLSGIHVLHGPGEAFAHLEHLERAGTVVAEDSDSPSADVVQKRREYRLADDVAAILADADGERWSLSV